MNSKISRSLRNLLRRPYAPAKGNGRLQVRARWALWALGEASTSEILQRTCAKKLHRGDRVREGDTWATRRALGAIGALKIGRAKTIGRPWVWKLK